MFKIVNDAEIARPSTLEGGVELDELCRLAATEMLAIALETERRAYLDAHGDVVDGAGRRVVVGNGNLPTRRVTTGAGMVEVRAPRVHDPRPEHRFSPAILPRYMRRSAKVTEVLPVLYLAGPVDGGLRSRPGGVLRFRRWAVGVDDLPVDRGVAGRTRPLGAA